jgi:hypothetical protein
MIFNKYNNYKQFSNDTIDLEQLITLIKESPLKSKILKLRDSVYKSSEYNTLKSQLASITPHGTFNDSKKGSIDSLSGYMYFDIDGFANTEELNSTIKKLNDTFALTFICKSCGGRGLAFLLKVKEITKDNFEITHAFIRNVFREEGYNIDKAAGGLIRKWIISYDTDIVYNPNAEYIMDMAAYEKFVIANTTTSMKVNKKKSDLDLNEDLEYDVIPFDVLCKLIKTESEYKGDITGDFTIEEMEYYKIIYPRIIEDGNKHSTYIRIINALYYLNKEITQHQILSYLFYVNNMAHPKMCISRLKALVTSICNSIEETGVIRIKTRTKKIHFNHKSAFTKSEKQSMGAVINGALRTNSTIDSITTMKATLEANNIVPTKSQVAKELSISLSTVKRNWNKEKTEIPSLVFAFKHKDKVCKSDQLSEFDYVEESHSDDNGQFSAGDDFFDESWDD